jgi:uncharacterized protein
MAAKFEIKKSKNGKQFLFNFKAANGQVVLSSEMYDAKKSAEKGIASVKKNAANDKRYERKTTKNGEPYFVLKAMNGEVIGTSERYTAAKSVGKGIASVKKNAPDARVVDLSA